MYAATFSFFFTAFNLTFTLTLLHVIGSYEMLPFDRPLRERRRKNERKKEYGKYRATEKENEAEIGVTHNQHLALNNSIHSSLSRTYYKYIHPYICSLILIYKRVSINFTLRSGCCCCFYLNYWNFDNKTLNICIRKWFLLYFNNVNKNLRFFTIETMPMKFTQEMKSNLYYFDKRSHLIKKNYSNSKNKKLKGKQIYKQLVYNTKIYWFCLFGNGTRLCNLKHSTTMDQNKKQQKI